MRKLLFSLMVLNFLNIATAQQDSLSQSKPVDTSKIFTVVEKMPLLLSCDSLDIPYYEKMRCSEKEVSIYVSKNFQYPLDARNANVQGLVVVKYVINTDGSVGEMEIIKSVHPALDEEALRLLKAMPAWSPGYQKGKAVRVSYHFPVKFKIQ